MMARRDIPDEMDVYRGYSKDGGEDHMSEDFKLEEPFIVDTGRSSSTTPPSR